jgi:hypothetical protein
VFGVTGRLVSGLISYVYEMNMSLAYIECKINKNIAYCDNFSGFSFAKCKKKRNFAAAKEQNIAISIR